MRRVQQVIDPVPITAPLAGGWEDYEIRCEKLGTYVGWLHHPYYDGWSYLAAQDATRMRFFWFHVEAPGQAIRWALSENLKGAAVHLALGRVDEPKDRYHGITYDDEARYNVLWLELDGGLGAFADVYWDIAPMTYIQTSPEGDRFHVMWRMEHPMHDSAAARGDSVFRRTLKGMALALNAASSTDAADASAATNHHLAPPFSVHTKPERRGWVRDVRYPAVYIPGFGQPKNIRTTHGMIDPEEMPRVEAPRVNPLPDVGATTDRAPSSAYVRRALDGEAQRVASAARGTRNNTLFSAAYNLGTLVGAGVLSYEQAYDSLIAVTTLEPREADQTLCHGLKRGMENPRQLTHVSVDLDDIL